VAEPHLDHPGEIHWFKGEEPAPVIGPCPHDCRHLGQGVIAWGPSYDRYELVECGVPGTEQPDACAGRCRAWIDSQGRTVTDWLMVDVGHTAAAGSPAAEFAGLPTDTEGCAYSATLDAAACGAEPTIHIASDAPGWGVVAFASCADHAVAARVAGVLLIEHPYGPVCTEGLCWPADAPGDGERA
jgi:hypothetical protein